MSVRLAGCPKGRHHCSVEGEESSWKTDEEVHLV